MFDVLIRNWWAFAVRGVLAIVFGLIAFFMPGVTMLSLVLVFAAYVIADGVIAVIGAVRAAEHHQRWGSLAFEGLSGIAAGALAVWWPELTVVIFVFLVAVWALLSGGFMLLAAFQLHIDHGRWWLVLGGAVSMIYGVLLLAAPMAGAVVLTWWIGAYALVFGIALLAVAFRLRAIGSRAA